MNGYDGRVSLAPDGVIYTAGPKWGLKSWQVEGYGVALSTSQSLILKSNPDRKAVLFCPPTAGIARIYPRVHRTVGNALQLTPFSAPILFKVADLGGIVTDEWYADAVFDPVGAPSVNSGIVSDRGAGTGAAVSITISGVTNEYRFLGAVLAQYDSPTQTGTVTIRVAASDHVIYPFTGAIALLGAPFLVAGALGNNIIVTLSAGGAGVVGRLSVTYYRYPAPRMMVYEFVGQ